MDFLVGSGVSYFIAGPTLSWNLNSV